MMGHAFQRCGFKIKSQTKANWQKKKHFSGPLFFLLILEADASAAVAAVGLGSI